MGAWSHESFGNDDACDWASDLEGARDLSAIESALDAVLDVGDGYLEAPEASQGIAAAEAVARLLGNFGLRDAYSEGIDAWVEKTHIKPNAALIAKTLSALDRIVAEPSELLELWQEGDDAGSWLGAVAELRARVHA